MAKSEPWPNENTPIFNGLKLPISQDIPSDRLSNIYLGDMVVISTGKRCTVAFGVELAFKDTRPWWCPKWLMKKVKKHIVKLKVKNSRFGLQNDPKT